MSDACRPASEPTRCAFGGGPTNGPSLEIATGRGEHWLSRPASAAVDAELGAETIRLNLRYQVEVIEAFNLCPWAKAARQSSNAVALVDDGRPVLDQIASAAELDTDVAFLILPTYTGDRLDFDEFVAQLIAEDARQHRDSSPPFAMAAFHPEGPTSTPNGFTPETLIPLLRRSPDPTIQLVRLSALERVRKGEPAGTSFIDPSRIDFAALLAKGMPERPSLRQRVANANHAAFSGPSGEAIRAALDDVLDDRRRTHQRLAFPPSAWEHSSP